MTGCWSCFLISVATWRKCIKVNFVHFILGLDQVEQLLRPGRPKKVQPDDWASSTDKEAGMCDRCGVLFSFRQALDKHRSSGNCVGVTEGSEGADEEEEETERCQECGERFTSRASLARHRQVHDVQRPFLCHCGRSYKRFRHLQAHLLQRHNTVIRETAVDAAVEVGANQETDAEQVEWRTTNSTQLYTIYYLIPDAETWFYMNCLRCVITINK